MIKETQDGSFTLYHPILGEHYHSIYGAKQESEHIFIQTALLHRLEYERKEPLRIFEVGFGTGLNAFLTLLKANELKKTFAYYGVEKYPVSESVYTQLLPSKLSLEEQTLWFSLQKAAWNEKQVITPFFSCTKIEGDLLQIDIPKGLDVIYFDAFSPEVQPSLWEESVFQTIFDHANLGAVLTTYCAKGEVRRRLQRAGFFVERLPGPVGKREILRATKPR